MTDLFFDEYRGFSQKEIGQILLEERSKMFGADFKKRKSLKYLDLSTPLQTIGGIADLKLNFRIIVRHVLGAFSR